MNAPAQRNGGLRCLSTRKSGRNSGGKPPYGNLSRIVNGFTRRTGRTYRRAQEVNKRIRKKKQKQLERCLLDLANAIDAGIQEYWRVRETMQRRYAQLYAEDFARRMGLTPKQ